MIKLDRELLEDLGLGFLEVWQMNAFLTTMYSELEFRVGEALAAVMTDRQLSEFEGFIDRKDEAGALGWLQANFPDYPETVRDVLQILKSEIRSEIADIRATSIVLR